MSEATTEAPQPKAEQEISPETASRRKKELGLVASSIFHGEASRDNPQDNPVAQAVLSAKFASERTAEQLQKDPLKFNIESSNEKGEPTKIDHDGQDAAIDEIVDVDEDDNLICKVINTADIGAEDAQKHTVTLSRKEVHDAILLAERGKIEGGLSGDELTVAQTYLDTIDPTKETPEITDEMAATVEQAAKDNGMLTGETLSNIVDKATPADSADRAKADALIASLEGKTVIDEGDFNDALGVLGINRGVIMQQANELREKINQQREILEKNPNDIFAKTVLEESNAKFTMLSAIYQKWGESEQKGETPFTEFFKKAQDGQLQSGEINNFLSGMAEGDYTTIADKLPDILGKTEEERKALKKAAEIAKKGGKGSLLIFLYLLAAAGSFAAGVVMEAAKNQSQ